jgi:hypothetical protein
MRLAQFITRAGAVVVAQVGLCAAAAAAVVVLPTAGPGPLLSAGDGTYGSESVTSGAFSVDYFFTLDGAASVRGQARDISGGFGSAADISILQISLYQGTTLLVSSVADAVNTLFAPVTLSAGNYLMRITGIAATPGGGVFETNAFVSAAPVPLPAAAWLLLSGLAGVGTFARRRATTAAA